MGSFSDIFPNNISAEIKKQILRHYPSDTVLLRPIRVGDPIRAWGVVAAIWEPDESSWELRGDSGPSSPTINRYHIGIQSFNQHMDSEEGLATAGAMAGFLRNMLSRDPIVRVALTSLTSTEFGFTERAKRFKVQGQRFVSNEIDGQFLFLTNLEFLVETEIT